MSSALQLPYDALPRPGATPELRSVRLPLVLPVGRQASPTLATTLAIMLARYGTQTDLPIGIGDGARFGKMVIVVAAHATAESLYSQLVVPSAVDLDGWRSATARVWWCGEVAGEPPVTPGGAALTLMAWQRANGAVEARFDFDQLAFAPSTISRMAGHLTQLLAHWPAHADSLVAELPLVTPDERTFLDEVSVGRARGFADPRLALLIEQHAERRPDKVAVRFGDQKLTYRELNRRANQLARRLSEFGVGAEISVPVCLEPCLDIAVAVLGVWKVGGVYVPVEPTYPKARIATILDDVAGKVMIVTSDLAAQLGLTERVRLDLGDLPCANDEDDRNPDVEVWASQAASIYYTSGTTGKPKGVVATQGNVTAYILTAQRRYAVDEHDVMPAIARFSFSISMFELMLPLSSGATLVVLARDQVLDVERLARIMLDLTFFHAGPSLLRALLPQLAAHFQPDDFLKIRHASTGGDLVAPDVLQAMTRQFPQAEVFVIYGCSEISCMGCTYPVPRGETLTRTYVGRPFEAMAVRVLDPRGQPVPLGVVGEIYFAGDGITRGYVGQPELTATRFVVVDGTRWYRTGDLGRLSGEGWLEILGRNDFQMKLRGMRLELGEVEYHLRRAPGVRDAVALGRPGPDGEPMLVAYVVFEPAWREQPGAQRARAAAIRRYLVDCVPDYMVPTAFVELAALPLNHNLKVDRFALPAPARDAPSAPLDDESLPQTSTERSLAALWSRILEQPTVSRADNFFDLGGDSMHAMEFIVAAEQELSVRLLGMDVLRESLEVLARICDAARGHDLASPSAAKPRAAAAESTAFHFGPLRQLYGVLHTPANLSTPPTHAVLLCPSIGHELSRAHFVISQLGRRLALAGIPSLRLDYYATGDSLGDAPVVSIDRWLDDLRVATRELKARTGATRISGVGVRLGALLLGTLADELDLASLAMWEPLTSGVTAYAELAAMQRDYLLGTVPLRSGRAPRRVPGIEDLGGVAYTKAALHELRRLALAPVPVDNLRPIGWLRTSDGNDQTARFTALCGNAPHCRQVSLELNLGFTDVTRMVDTISDAGVSRALFDLLALDENLV